MPEWDFRRGSAGTRVLVQAGEQRGIEPSALLVGTGLSWHDVSRGEVEVEAGQELQVGRNLVAAIGDEPGLGADAGARYTLASFGMAGFALLTAATGRDMVRLGLRFAPLSFAFIRPALRNRDDVGVISLHDEEIPSDVRSLFVERELAKVGRLLPAVLGATESLTISTRFSDTRANALRAVLPSVRIFGGAPCHEVTITGTALDAPLPQADATMAAALEAQCVALLDQRRRRTGTAADVRSQLLRDLARQQTLPEIAHALHLDERTLRRRLTDQGTTFRALRDETLSAIAVELLKRGGLTVAEVAQRLGYHDAAGFSRAYRRWTGTTPRGSAADIRSSCVPPPSPTQRAAVSTSRSTRNIDIAPP